MRTHVLRRILGPVLAQASVFAGVTLVFQAALSYLGLLSSSTHPTWGGMIGDASQVISRSTWPLIPPGIAISLTVLAFGAVEDALRDLAADGPVAAPRRSARSGARSVATEGAGEPSEPQAGALLDVRGLSVAVNDRLTETALVIEVSFSIEQGETVALVGESGCGKSLTALAVMGLLPPGVHRSSGCVRFGGARLQASPVADPVVQRKRQLPAPTVAVRVPAGPPRGCIYAPRCAFAAPECHRQRPRLRQIAPGRAVACHRYPEWTEVIDGIRPGTC